MSSRNARWPVATLAVVLIACSNPGDGNDPDLGIGDPDLRDPLPAKVRAPPSPSPPPTPLVR